MVVQNVSANGKETDLTFTIKTEDLNKTKKIIKANNIRFRKLLLKKMLKFQYWCWNDNYTRCSLECFNPCK